jgi:hypothetical protein
VAIPEGLGYDFAMPPRRLLAAVGVFAVTGALALLGSLYVDGRFPAAVPVTQASYSLAPLAEALRAVDSRGKVDVAALGQRKEALEAYVKTLASWSPLNTPQAFESPDEQLAYWLNASHALLLQVILEQGADAPLGGATRLLRTWPIGGERLSLYAIERRFLDPSGDARVYLSLATGGAEGPALDGVPFDAATLDGQLNDAARRFVRRKENVSIERGVVRLSPVFEAHQAAFKAALPAGDGNLLGVVWAFLPESCDGVRPGCDTRKDLDLACGGNFEKCRVEYLRR